MVDSKTRSNEKLIITIFLLVRENLKDIANRSDSIGSSKFILRLLNFFKQKYDDFLACSIRKRVMLIAPEAQNMHQSL